MQNCYSNLLQWRQLHLSSGFLVVQVFFVIPLFVIYSTHLIVLLSNVTSIIIGNINGFDLCICYCCYIMSWPKFICISIQIIHCLLYHPLSMEQYNKVLKGKIVELFGPEFTNIFTFLVLSLWLRLCFLEVLLSIYVSIFSMPSLYTLYISLSCCSVIWIVVCTGIFCIHISFKNHTVWC